MERLIFIIIAAAAAILLAGVIYYLRRYFQRLGAPHKALQNSPLAFARFGFPGFNLLEYNSAFKRMAASGSAKATTLFDSFPAGVTERLAEFMDQAIATGQEVTCEQFQIISPEDKSSFWQIEFIPKKNSKHGGGQDLTMFAIEVTEQALRSRIREAVLRISTTVMSNLDVEETARVVLDSLAYITGADAGALFLIEDEQWERRAITGQIDRGESMRLRTPYENLGNGVEAIENRRVVVVGSQALDNLLIKGGMRQGKAYMIVPLVAGDRPVGAVWLNQIESAPPFTQDQIEFAGVIGSHGALAIENASIYEKEKRARKSLEAIEAVSEAGLMSLDMEELLKELASRAQSVMGMDAAVIFLLDDSGQYLEIREATDKEINLKYGKKFLVTEGLAGSAFAANEPMKIDDLHSMPEACPAFKDSGIASALAVPLRMDGSPTGVLILGSLRAGAFSINDWELIQVIADRASLAVHNSILHAQTREELTKVRLLRDVAAVCAGPLNLQEIASQCLAATERWLGCRTASIYCLDSNEKALINIAFTGSETEIIEHLKIRRLEENTMLVRAVLEQRIITSDDAGVETLSPADAFIINGLHANDNRLCTMPLVCKGEVVGAMAMVFPDRKPFTPSMIDTILSLANQLAVAVHSNREPAAF